MLNYRILFLERHKNTMKFQTFLTREYIFKKYEKNKFDMEESNCYNKKQLWE